MLPASAAPAVGVIAAGGAAAEFASVVAAAPRDAGVNTPPALELALGSAELKSVAPITGWLGFVPGSPGLAGFVGVELPLPAAGVFAEPAFAPGEVVFEAPLPAAGG
jgi:hypothetical protein